MLLPLAAALLAGLLLPTVQASRPDVSPAAVAEIRARADAPLLLDVRSPEEFAAGHVAGAVNIPHDRLASRLQEVQASDRPWVLVYCRSGKRADSAESVLAEAGFEVRQINGSWLRWEAEGRPVEMPRGVESAQ
ncbi:MAG: rhodanese-like domain-containing protein [Arenimonas sp.]|uniref:rhodanese-like domain-containing protein n=1 Tax=Arenimonas sp. TaxID=1872635 RepID=UPI0025BF0B37|nr:rhodanese-like domain-containing protein [Arenimonas sp.]MBW8366889.1 rhodanese-like domain-containing protein [Arenimonas sp.]